MKNLILMSDGFTEESCKNDNINELLKRVADGKKVMILGNATLGGSNFSQRELVKARFETAGAKQVDIIDINRDNTATVLEYEVLYVIGGDPRFLLNMLYETNVKESISQFLHNGGIYIGESAGSMILGKKLKWVWDVKKGTKPKYDIEPKCYDGLGFTNYNIFPHWNKYSEEIQNRALNHVAEITPLNDGEFIETEYTAW